MDDYSLRGLAARLLRSADFARAFTLAAFGAAFGSFAIERLTNRVTLVTIIASLCVVGAGILVARRRELRPLGFAPTTLVAFAAWALVSTVWSYDESGSFSGWLGLASYGFLALVIGQVRDAIQTVRAVGDVLRVLLSASLIVEVLSGILFDMPFTFLGVTGAIATGGPIQGLFGTRNLLALVSVIALVTFVIEWRTQSVTTRVAIWSIGLAGFLAVFSASPTAVVLTVAVAAALGALRLARRTPPSSRLALQGAFASLVVVGLVVGYALRHPILRWLDATTGFSLRADLWNEILDWVRLRPVQGFGWRGSWSSDDFPLRVINLVLDQSHRSALNAFFDVLLQLGWVGLLLFIALCAFAFVRSWLTATERRSIVYAWTPIVLTALLVDSMFESFTLTGVGWLLLALCTVRAGQSRSWREKLDLAASGGESQDPLGRPR